MNFVVLDIFLLVLFVLVASIFLYRNKKNLKKEGALLLYKTSWGVKFIDYIGKKYQKTLKVLSYVSITTGYLLMIGVIILIFQTVYLYLTTEISQVIKAPPIAPLIPYFPKLFGLQSFFPPFYFVYFIIAILIVATVHEFAHGIFARRYKIKIKSTGFAFLKYFPALFGAFVEQDDTQMNRAKKFEQMSILSGGVFANVTVAVLFYFVLFAFFKLTFIPVGVQFSTYSYSVINVAGISSINNISVNSYDEVLSLTKTEGLNKIVVGGKGYVATKNVLEEQKENEGIIILYDDSPAINSQIGSVIAEINGVKITSIEKLQEELNGYSPGEEVNIKTNEKNGDYGIVLGENPKNKSAPWLGVGFYNNENKISKIIY
ncbi:MAG: site-2 protease family protein, partial [Nanoarchaeota archaeon]|nr:site-2 protease family protein [Nanoarchaeota archaeon]